MTDHHPQFRCLCGHKKIVHEPKCQISGCGCMTFRPDEAADQPILPLADPRTEPGWTEEKQRGLDYVLKNHLDERKKDWTKQEQAIRRVLKVVRNWPPHEAALALRVAADLLDQAVSRYGRLKRNWDDEIPVPKAGFGVDHSPPKTPS